MGLEVFRSSVKRWDYFGGPFRPSLSSPKADSGWT